MFLSTISFLLWQSLTLLQRHIFDFIAWNLLLFKSFQQVKRYDTKSDLTGHENCHSYVFDKSLRSLGNLFAIHPLHNDVIFIKPSVIETLTSKFFHSQSRKCQQIWESSCNFSFKFYVLTVEAGLNKRLPGGLNSCTNTTTNSAVLVVLEFGRCWSIW